MTGDIIIFFENDPERYQFVVTATDGRLSTEQTGEPTQPDQDEHYPDGKEN